MSKNLIPKVFPQNVWLRKIVDQCIPSAKFSDSCDDSKEPPKNKAFYDIRKYGHKLPCDSVKPCFEPLPGIPTGVFRCTDGECLGRGADKRSFYKNPEYFSFHHMSFYDFHLILRACRQPSAISGRKK